MAESTQCSFTLCVCMQPAGTPCLMDNCKFNFKQSAGLAKSCLFKF